MAKCDHGVIRRWVVCGALGVVGVGVGPVSGAASAAPPADSTTTTASPAPTLTVTVSPSVVHPGEAYTLSGEGCGTGWTVSATISYAGHDVGTDQFILQPNVPLPVVQTSSGFTITRHARMVTLPPETLDSPLHRPAEMIEVVCMQGPTTLTGTGYVTIRGDVGEFDYWEVIVHPGIFVVDGWKIHATTCTIGSTATLVATSGAHATLTLTAPVDSDRFIRFLDPGLTDFVGDATAKFTVTCQAPDGVRTITIPATLASGGGSSHLPGTGSSSPGALWLAAGLCGLGLTLRRTVRRA